MTQESSSFTLPKEVQSYLYFQHQLAAIPPRQELLLEQFPELLGKVCRPINIGKVDVILDIPANSFSPEGMAGRRIAYSDGIVDVFHPVVKSFRTDQGGMITLEFYKKGKEAVTEEEEFWIDRIAETLFVFMGRARMSSMLYRSLQTDHTTGLPNTGEYMRRLGELIEAGEIMKYAAAYFNIRNFKYINKLVNYQSGDEVMVQYVTKVSAFLEKDELMARLGGDNYVVLVHKENLSRFLDQLDAVTVDVATHSGIRKLSMPARIGIYEIDRPVRHPGEIMMAISVALQISREPGSDARVFYNGEMSQEVLYEKKVVLDFTRALERGQFRAYFQPKVNLKSGRLCGAEALARWENKGLVTEPSGFVPMLEKDGAICRLDFEMLRQTCEMLATWQAKGLELLPISVNMSRWHLRDEDFVENVHAILKDFEIDPKWIEIELTETVDYEEYRTMVKALGDLRERGFMTAIDDFGSGYSSLTMLHKTDVDVIKLDRGFLWEQTEKGSILLRNVIRMAKELGIAVLAEGVETVGQRNLLIESDCDMAQGFLYAKPMKKEEFERRAFS